MKKLFNNSTKGNDTQNQSSKSERKFLKTFSFTSLALLMGIAGTIAFAPLGASPSVANASEMVDQINTKADGENIKYAPSALGLDPENDPVIYTTESGLEIKFGGVSVNNSITTSKLAGYPYFTLGKYSGYDVNWIIFGRNPSDTVFVDKISEYVYSTWKSNSASSATIEPLGTYFFNNVAETKTPAGLAIDTNSASRGQVSDLSTSTQTIFADSNVPQGTVLVISECVLFNTQFRTSSAAANYKGSNLQTKMEELYTSGLGLTDAQKNLFVPQTIENYYWTYTSSSDTSGYTVGTSENQHFFPLATYSMQFPRHYYGFGDVATQANRIAYLIGTSTATAYWGRDGHPNEYRNAMTCSTAGGYSMTSVAVTSSLGVRPCAIVDLA